MSSDDDEEIVFAPPPRQNRPAAPKEKETQTPVKNAAEEKPIQQQQEIQERKNAPYLRYSRRKLLAIKDRMGEESLSQRPHGMRSIKRIQEQMLKEQTHSSKTVKQRNRPKVAANAVRQAPQHGDNSDVESTPEWANADVRDSLQPNTSESDFAFGLGEKELVPFFGAGGAGLASAPNSTLSEALEPVEVESGTLQGFDLDVDKLFAAAAAAESDVGLSGENGVVSSPMRGASEGSRFSRFFQSPVAGGNASAAPLRAQGPARGVAPATTPVMLSPPVDLATPMDFGAFMNTIQSAPVAGGAAFKPMPKGAVSASSLYPPMHPSTQQPAPSRGHSPGGAVSLAQLFGGASQGFVGSLPPMPKGGGVATIASLEGGQRLPYRPMPKGGQVVNLADLEKKR